MKPALPPDEALRPAALRGQGVPAPAAGLPPRKVEPYLRLAFAAAALVLVLLGVTAARSVLRTSEDAAWVNHTHQVIEGAQDLQTHLLAAELDLRNDLLTGQDAFLASSRDQFGQARAGLSRLRGQTSDNPVQQRNLEALAALVDQHAASAGRRLGLGPALGPGSAEAQALQGEDQAGLERVRARCAGIVAEEESLLARRRAAAKASSRRTLAFVGGLGLLSLALVPLFAYRTLLGLRQRKEALALVEGVNRLLARRTVELAAARDAAEASDRIKAAILASAGNAIIATTPEGAIAQFNPAAERMLGYSAGEVMGRPFALLADPVQLAARTRALSEELGESLEPGVEGLLARPRRNLPEEAEWTLRRKDGSAFTALFSLTPVTDAEGRLNGFLGLATDITERKRAEEALRAKNEELRTFGYTVSHDLKAPLRGISGYAQELERSHQEGLSERARFCLAQILVATRNLDLLIEDLLKFSRLEDELPTLREVDLPVLVGSILGDRDRTLRELGVELTVDLPPFTLRTWERGLAQVLANLIDNAVKYSARSRPPRLAITAGARPGGFRLTVADNGIGFDMKYHDRIFGLFNRLVRPGDFQGTGAGLAIVKKLTEKLGGTIRAEAEPGRGATFYLDLPATSVQERPT